MPEAPSTIKIAGADPGLQATLIAAGLPIEDLGEPGGEFLCIENEEALLGYGGFELYGADALVRSIVVPPDARGKGNGRNVTEAVLRAVSAAGGRRAFLLTTTAAEFFIHLGFAPVARSDAPPAILATRQASSICSTAALLARDI